VVGVTGLGAWRLGGLAVASRWRLPHPALQVASETGVGLLMLSYLLYAVSMAGYLLATPVVSTVLLQVVFAGMTLAAIDGGRVLWPRRRELARALEVSPGVAAVAAGLSGLAVWTLLCAALPVTSLDEMVYHLEVPKRILQVGYLPAFTDNVLAYYPMGPQMLFLYGLGVSGETAARLFHSLHGLLVLVAIYGYTRTLLDRIGAVTAALLYATVPTVMVISAWAYIDNNFTLYAFLALVGTLQYIEARETSEREGLGWALFAGLMAGAAWTVKYTGLQLVLLLALVVLVAELRSRTRRLPFGLVALGGLAFLLFLPHLARTWLITGWPLFPFGLGPFELTGVVNWSVEQSDLALEWQRQYGAGYDRTLYERLMSSVWVYTSAKDNYTAYDGIVGSVFLLAPLALLVRRRPPQVARLAVFALAYTLYWTLTTTQVRFLIPLLPVMAILVAVAISDRLIWLGRAAVAICVAISLFQAADSVLPASPGRYWSGELSAEEYLAKRLGPYPIYMEANRRLGPGDRLYLVNMRTWGYLLDMPGRGEMWPFPNGWRSDYTFEHFNLQRALVAARSPADIDEFFGSRGITHIMIDEEVTLGADGLLERERTILTDYFQRRATLLYRNPRDPRQSLWKLNLAATPPS
jgi:hypothetical protein